MNIMQFKYYLAQMALLAVPILFSLAMHELAHGYSAYILGDPTPKIAGRLTLNPFKHLSLVGIAFLFVTKAIGWAKPIPVSPGNLDKPRMNMLIVALAGPFSNAVIALAASLLFHLLPAHSNTSLITPIPVMLQITISINVSLAIFNLFPIPPLDGSRVVECLLPEKFMRTWLKAQPIGIILLITLLITGFFSKYLIPLIHQINSVLI